MPAVLEQKVRNLLPGNGNLLNGSFTVRRAESLQPADWPFARFPEGLKGENLAGLVVVQQSEIP